MTMILDGMKDSEINHHAKNKTGDAGRSGLKKNRTNSPAHSRAMTNAGGHGLKLTLLVQTRIGTAGTPGPTTSLVMAKLTMLTMLTVLWMLCRHVWTVLRWC